MADGDARAERIKQSSLNGAAMLVPTRPEQAGYAVVRWPECRSSLGTVTGTYRSAARAGRCVPLGHLRRVARGAPALHARPMSDQTSVLIGIELIVGLLVVAVALALLAKRLTTPQPVVLAIGGLLLGVVWHYVPGTPDVQIAPQQVLALFLPPVLAWAAFTVPLGAFRANLGPITLLAVVLVFATMGLVAAVTRAFDPTVPWAAAFVLGAIVAPPDPVAATSVGGQLGLRNRLVTIMEGEGLVNDATALVAYQLAVEAAVTGQFSWGHATIELVRTAPLGIVVGLAVAYLTAVVLRRIDDPVIETTISLMAPYVAYVAAESVGGSAILAVVAHGFLLRRKLVFVGRAPTRIASRTVWQTVNFIVTALVFLLIGVELGRSSATGLGVAILWRGALVSVAAIVVRLVWMLVIPSLTAWIGRVWSGQPRAPANAPRTGSRGTLPDASDPQPDTQPTSFKERVVLGWAGMRGVVSLALALAIPARTASGAPFPHRTQLVFLSFAVIFATLVGQGLTLAPLVHWLGVGDPNAAREQEDEARRYAVNAGESCLAELPQTAALPRDIQAKLREKLRHEVGLASPDGIDSAAQSAVHAQVRHVLGEVLTAERDAVLRLREAGHVSDEIAQRLEVEIDVDQVRLDGTAQRVANA